MTIITVRGMSDSGKTSVLKDVYTYLKNDGARIDENNTRLEGKDEDIVSLFYWNEKKIEICSIGDNAKDDGEKDCLKYVKYGTDLAVRENVNILLNAVSTSVSYDDFKQLLDKQNSDNHYRILFMNRYENSPELQLLQEQTTCREICALLEVE